jgi:hypothetical protein
MQNRNQALNNGDMPNWQGGGAFLVSGTMYFHQCKTTGGVDSGGVVSTCDANSAYTDQLIIGGNASGTSYILGDIIIDQLKLNGGPNLYMDLSPAAQFPTYKASLLR